MLSSNVEQDQIADFEDNFLTECRMFRPFVMYFDAYKVIGDSSSKKSFSPLFFARIEVCSCHLADNENVLTVWFRPRPMEP